MAPNIDPYKVLGIQQDATEEEVKRAYRAKAAKYHPDAGGDAWVFQQVNSAYEYVLKQRSTTTARKSESPKPPNPTTATAWSADQSTKGANEQERANTPSSDNETSRAELTSFLFGKLPLQNETTFFILVNVLDIFATYALLRFGGIEANPIANYFLLRWNVKGLVAFKMVLVAFVAILAQVIARRNTARARQVLILGTVIVSAVVLYSVYLLAQRL